MDEWIDRSIDDMGCGQARDEEDYQKQFLYDPNSTLEDFVDTFKITRPIPLVQDGCVDVGVGFDFCNLFVQATHNGVCCPYKCIPKSPYWYRQ